jgi:hypothetical protein
MYLKNFKLKLLGTAMLLAVLGMSALQQPLTSPTEENPPVAERIFIQKVRQTLPGGGNAVLLAQFPKNTPSLRDTRSFKMNTGDQSFREFFDDGTNGDEKPGDGIFTTPINISEGELFDLTKRNNLQIERNKGEQVLFINRQRVTRKLQPFDAERFRTFVPVPLDLITLSTITAANLPTIMDKSLIVRDVSVVEDLTRTYDPCRTPSKGNPTGVWSFGTLITNMANTPVTGITPKQFLTDWVDKFLFGVHAHPGSGDATANRAVSKERLVKAWMQNSGLPVAAGALPANWHTLALKVEEFPVRLLAIVNRVDLRGNSGYGFSNAGEGRFVFCFVDSRSGCSHGNNGPGTMTFIFEYGVPLRSCNAVRDYGKKWWDLQTIAFGPAYNTALESLTSVFTSANAAPSKPNRNALNHLRTNDFIQSPWDIRDFLIDGTSKMLKIVHPNKEPMKSANGPAASVANTNLVIFTNGALPPNYVIPNNLAGMEAPMLSPSHHWRGTVATPMVNVNRQNMSFNSCSGCHTGETKNPFTHIRPRNVSTKAVISGFMSGLGADDNPGDGADNDPMGSFFVNDPGPAPKLPQAGFNETLRRAIDLENLKNRICPPPFIRERIEPIDVLLAFDHTLRFMPVNMEH